MISLEIWYIWPSPTHLSIMGTTRGGQVPRDDDRLCQLSPSTRQTISDCHIGRSPEQVKSNLPQELRHLANRQNLNNILLHRSQILHQIQDQGLQGPSHRWPLKSQSIAEA